MFERDNKAIARRYYDEIMNEAKLATIDELMSPDFVFTLATHPEPFHGPEGFKQLITMLHGAFPDVHLTVEHLLADGDYVVGHWIGTGTHTGGPLRTVMGDIPPSGRRFRIDGMSWLKIVDGKIQESLANEDSLGMLTQLGVLPAAQGAPARQSTPEQNVASMGRYFDELMNQGRLEVIDELMAPDFTLRIPTLPEPVRGPEGMKRFVTALRTGFPDIRFTVERHVADGDKVAARWFIEGTHQGPFLGIPPTNNQVRDQGVDIFVFRDGRLVELWVNENDLGLMHQLGVLQFAAPQTPREEESP
jgi:steroid delta-isomerase-like uncharacterized protein